MRRRRRLEKHFRDMQDIEFTIQEGTLFMLQCRDGKRSGRAAVRMAVEMVSEGLITKDEALLRVDPTKLNQLLHPTLDPRRRATCWRAASTPRRAPPAARSSSAPTTPSAGRAGRSR